jgi:CheY-like chemotaxis protein
MVDDDEINRIVVTALFEAEGARCDAVADGEGALVRARDVPYDLILVDVELPGMDGPAITRALRAMACASPIYALSGHSGGERVAEALAAGADGALTKPLRRADLDRMLRRASHAP